MFRALAPALALAFFAVACAEDALPGTESPLPDYGLWLADGVVDPLAPDYAPVAPAAFLADELGFTEDEAEQERADTKAFFLDTYGVDVDALVAEGRIQFIEYVVDPGANYRVRAMPDRVVQAEGWPIGDLAFTVAIADPMGLELGGAYAGITAGPGVLAVRGFYVFDALDAQGNVEETITVRYQSNGLAGTTLDGRSVFFCDMESDQLGRGIGKVTSSIVQMDDGRISYDFTNVQEWGL